MHSFVAECSVLICDFHREQAWDRWLSAAANGMRSNKDTALSSMRRIANAESVEEYEQTVQDMKATLIWNAEYSKKFRNWLEKTWLPLHKVIQTFNS